MLCQLVVTHPNHAKSINSCNSQQLNRCRGQPLPNLIGSISSEEGQEVMDDAEGRWLSFCVKKSDLMILERKSIPQHLSGLECLETPASFVSVLNDLEDAGEVMGLHMEGTSIS